MIKRFDTKNPVVKNCGIFLLFVLVFSAHLNAYSAIDVSSFGLSARPMGRGHAGVAYRDTADALLLNPAMLSARVTSSISLFSTQILQDVSYVAISGTIPMQESTLGLAYVRAGISDIPRTGLDENLRPIELDTLSYEDSLLMLGVGVRANKMNADWSEQLTFGATLKYFSKQVPGLAYAYGFNIDMGAHYILSDEWQVGLVQRNVFSALGNSWNINWNTGAVDILPRETVVGLSYTGRDYVLLGDVGFSDQRERKSQIHLGAEYSLFPQFIIRAGTTQLPDSVGYTTQYTYTLGCSLSLYELAVDYAYEPWTEVQYNTHYASLKYSF